MDPQYEIWHQCREMLESIPIKQWEGLSIDHKRRAAILSKWTIEKLLTAMIIARGKKPSSMDLRTLYTESIAKIASDHEALLFSIIPEISAEETGSLTAELNYEKAYWLAMNLKEYTLNCITIWDVQQPNSR
jgi:hypothetical protein